MKNWAKRSRPSKNASGRMEKAVGVVQGRVGVAIPAVAADEIAVAVRVREFFRTKKQHVLEEVRQAQVAFRLGEAAHVYGESRRRLVAGEVAHKEHLQAVGEHPVAVAPGVDGAFLDDHSVCFRR